MQYYNSKLNINLTVYKYNILERVIVEKIILRNVIINRGTAKVDNHISRDDFSTFTLSRMLYLFYYTEHYSFFSIQFSSYHGAGSSMDSTLRICYEWMR